MSYAKQLLGYREFWEESKILGLTKGFAADDFEEGAKSLKIFSTSKQHTWLVATTKRLYCILDDIRKSKPRLQWSVPKESLLEPGQITSRDKSEKTGLVDIGNNHKNWLYSKKLFTGEPIEASIKKLLSG